MRDMHHTATSIGERVPMLMQLIELCRRHLGEFSREPASVSTHHAGPRAEQPVWPALFIFQELSTTVVCPLQFGSQSGVKMDGRSSGPKVCLLL